MYIKKESKSSRIVRQYIEQCREEGIEKGREEGREEGALNTIIRMIDDGFLTIRDAKEKYGISASKLKKARALV